MKIDRGKAVKIWANLGVDDLARTFDFYTGLGFESNMSMWMPIFKTFVILAIATFCIPSVWANVPNYWVSVQFKPAASKAELALKPWLNTFGHRVLQNLLISPPQEMSSGARFHTSNYALKQLQQKLICSFNLSNEDLDGETWILKPANLKIVSSSGNEIDDIKASSAIRQAFPLELPPNALPFKRKILVAFTPGSNVITICLSGNGL